MKGKRKRIVRADTESGQIAGEAMVEAVENQLADNIIHLKLNKL